MTTYAVQITADGRDMGTVSIPPGGHVTVQPGPSGEVIVRITEAAPPKDEPLLLLPSHVMEQISRYVEEHPGATFADIRAACPGRHDTLRRAIDQLKKRGDLTGTRRGHAATTYHVVRPPTAAASADTSSTSGREEEAP